MPPFRLTSPRLDRRGFVAAVGAFAASCAHAEPELPKISLRAMPLQRLVDDRPVAVLGYEGRTPGPTLQAALNVTHRLETDNAAGSTASLQWHGLRHRSETRDGIATFTPLDAGTVLYRPPLTPAGIAQIEAGLSGLLIVPEPDAPAVDQDIAIGLQDWSTLISGKAGELPPAAQLTANGAPRLALTARPLERLRLRFANLTARQPMMLALPFVDARMIAFDGQPCEVFAVDTERLVLAPGQRIDLIVDCPAGPTANPMPLRVTTAQGQFSPVMFTVIGDARRDQPLGGVTTRSSSHLPSLERFQRALRLDLRIDQNGPNLALNGRVGDDLLREPLLKARRDQTVILALINSTKTLQSIYLDGHPFRLLDGLDDGWKPYWLNSLLIAPDQTARIAFQARAGRWGVDCVAVAATAIANTTIEIA